MFSLLNPFLPITCSAVRPSPQLPSPLTCTISGLMLPSQNNTEYHTAYLKAQFESLIHSLKSDIQKKTRFGISKTESVKIS